MAATYDPSEHPKDAKGQWATKVQAVAEDVDLGHFDDGGQAAAFLESYTQHLDPAIADTVAQGCDPRLARAGLATFPYSNASGSVNCGDDFDVVVGSLPVSLEDVDRCTRISATPSSPHRAARIETLASLRDGGWAHLQYVGSVEGAEPRLYVDRYPTEQQADEHWNGDGVDRWERPTAPTPPPLQPNIWPGTEVTSAEFDRLGTVTVGDCFVFEQPMYGPGPVRTVASIGLESNIVGHDGNGVVWGPGRQAVAFEPDERGHRESNGFEQRGWRRAHDYELVRDRGDAALAEWVRRR